MARPSSVVLAGTKPVLSEGRATGGWPGLGLVPSRSWPALLIDLDRVGRQLVGGPPVAGPEGLRLRAPHVPPSHFIPVGPLRALTGPSVGPRPNLGPLAPTSTSQLALRRQQVAQAKKECQTLRVLRQSPVAYLGVAEHPLHFQERVPHLGPRRCLATFRQGLRTPRVKFPAFHWRYRHLPFHLTPQVLISLVDSLVPSIAPPAGKPGGPFPAWDRPAGCAPPASARESVGPCAPGTTRGGSCVSCPGIPGRRKSAGPLILTP